MINKSTVHPIHQCSCPTCQQHPYGAIAQQHHAINRVLATLDEQTRRRFVGLLTLQWGPRSIALLARVTGSSRMTIYRGKYEIEHALPKRQGRLRAPGAGRPRTEKKPGYSTGVRSTA